MKAGIPPMWQEFTPNATQIDLKRHFFTIFVTKATTVVYLWRRTTKMSPSKLRPPNSKK